VVEVRRELGGCLAIYFARAIPSVADGRSTKPVSRFLYYQRSQASVAQWVSRYRKVCGGPSTILGRDGSLRPPASSKALQGCLCGRRQVMDSQARFFQELF